MTPQPLREWREKNRERYNEYQRKWRAANREKCAEYARRSRESLSHDERAKRNRERYEKRKSVPGWRGRMREARTKRGKEVLKNEQLRIKYGISIEEYHRMLEEQQGVCAICKQSSNRALAVDHDHSTGRVRGLLCTMCNRGIGFLKDSPALLRSAMEYLS